MPWGELNRPTLTFLKSFSHDLLTLAVFTTCGSPFFFSFFFTPIDKEDKNRQCEFKFSLLLMRQIPWPLVRLFVFWSGYSASKLVSLPDKAWDAAIPWDIEKLCIRQLNVRGVSHSASTCLHGVNNNHGNLFIAITTAVCAKQRWAFFFLSIFPPLINKQHFGDSSQPKRVQSQLIYNAAVLVVFGPH